MFCHEWTIVEEVLKTFVRTSSAETACVVQEEAGAGDVESVKGRECAAKELDHEFLQRRIFFAMQN